MGVDIPGIHTKGVFISALGLAILAGFPKGDAERIGETSIRRLQRAGGFQGRRRLARAPQGDKRASVIVECGGVLRPDFQRALQRRRRQRKSALAAIDEAQIVVRIGIRRIQGQSDLQRFFRRLELALRVQR